MTATTISYPPETQINASLTASLETGDIRLIDKLAAPWARLCKESNAEIFLTPEWIRCYLQAFEPKTRLVVISVWEGERLLAILPLTHKWIWYHGIRLLELKGAANAHSVMFDVLRAPGPAGEAGVAAIWHCIRDFDEWHVLQLPYFPESGSSQQVLSSAEIDGYATLTDIWADGPYMSLQRDNNSQVDIFHGTTRKFRQELRRRARSLDAEIGATRQLTRVTSNECDILTDFFKLEAAGWKGRVGTAINSSAETLLFYRDIARLSAQRGAFSLYMLHAGTKLIAANFSVQTGQVLHIMKGAYDESLSRWGPGHLLTAGVLDDCVIRGIGQVSFGGKDESYKKCWMTATKRSLNGFVFNRQLRSQITFWERSQLFPALRRMQMPMKRYLGA
jgi:CelD/BcsL family acetyltransferase involved in cellulose biosynthesis